MRCPESGDRRDSSQRALEPREELARLTEDLSTLAQIEVLIGVLDETTHRTILLRDVESFRRYAEDKAGALRRLLSGAAA